LLCKKHQACCILKNPSCLTAYFYYIMVFLVNKARFFTSGLFKVIVISIFPLNPIVPVADINEATGFTAMPAQEGFTRVSNRKFVLTFALK